LPSSYPDCRPASECCLSFGPKFAISSCIPIIPNLTPKIDFHLDFRRADADLFADLSSDAPLKEGHFSILSTDGPGLSPNEPMAIVQVETHQSRMGGISLKIEQMTFIGMRVEVPTSRFIFNFGPMEPRP
jgi:hypothetical protein